MQMCCCARGGGVSYDVSLEIDTGGEYPAAVGCDNHNCTYNVAKMFHLAFTGDKGLYAIEDLTAADAAPLVGDVQPCT